jgi:hypothetical protein
MKKSKIANLRSKIFKSRPSRVGLRFFTLTIYQISVCTAFLAQAFTVFSAKKLPRQIKQYLLAHKLFQIEFIPAENIGFQVVGIERRFLFGRKILFRDKADIERDIKRRRDRIQTPCTIDLGVCPDRSFNIRLYDMFRNGPDGGNIAQQPNILRAQIDLIGRDREFKRMRRSLKIYQINDHRPLG